MTSTKRQARGLARIEQILGAAAAEIAEGGVDAASMNAIARRAGISPGSLYQFFSDKQSLVALLVERFRDMFEQSLPADPAAVLVLSSGLGDLLDRIVDPVIAFNVQHPGFRALFVRVAEHGDLVDLFGPIHDSLNTRLVDLIRARAPRISASDALRIAELCHAVFRGVVPLIVEASEPERSRVVAEFKTMLVRYLEPYHGL